MPWRARLRDPSEVAFNSSPDFGDDLVIGIVIWIVVVMLAVLAPIALSILFLPLEILLVALVLPFALLGRVLFGRKWRVEIRRGWTPWHEFLAGDWRASGLGIHATAEQIRHGDVPARTLRGMREDSSPPGDENSSR